MLVSPIWRTFPSLRCMSSSHLSTSRRAVIAVISGVALGAALLGLPTAAQSADETTSAATPSPRTSLTFMAGLPFDEDALVQAAQQVSTPGTATYRKFTDLRRAGAKFGATPQAIRALRTQMNEAGVRVQVDRTRLFARLTAPLSVWEDIMEAPITYLPATEGSSALGSDPYATYLFIDPDSGLLLAAPEFIADLVTAFVPAATIYDAALDIPGTIAGGSVGPSGIYGGDVLPWPTNGGSPLGTGCQDPIVTEGQVITPLQTRTAYGTQSLLQRGAPAHNARVTILSNGGGFSRADLRAFAECLNVANPRVDVVLGTGITQEIVSWSSETHLDLQTTAGALRDARSIRIVQSTPDNLFIGSLDGFARALDQDGQGRISPDSVSFSYGGCELDPFGRPVQAGTQGQPLVPVQEAVFQMAAVVGTGVFIAAGDFGSGVCQRLGEPAIPVATVSYPASSPWVTAVGGTRLRLGEGNVRLGEAVWNDQRYGAPDAGTGGPSQVFPRPWYQASITPSDQRAVPDVSALAAVIPGWPVVYGAQLQPIGGTSGSSPFVASSTALVSAIERSAGRPPVGFANPWLYSAPYRTFYDIRGGDNQLAFALPDGRTNILACCEATRGYDMASGLGAPLFNRLANNIPQP